MTDHIRTNLRLWQKQSKRYDRRFARALSSAKAMAWGFWRTPESTLRLLEEIRGRDILEVGCGGARWSIALAQAGAQCVGLDFSSAQLAHARRESRGHRSPVSLVRASVETIPFRSAKFDRVFCDFGALTFADPHRAIPECSRVLRPGGLLVFATGSPIDAIARDLRHGRLQRRLLRPYFGLSRIEFPNEVNFQLPYGEWIRLFRQHHLIVERLVESQPTGRQRSAYLSRSDSAWAIRWPLECIWKLRKIRPQHRSELSR